MDNAYKSLKNISEVLPKYDKFIFDLDGTIWEGNTIFPEAIKTVKYLQEKEKSVYFITANNDYDREAYAEKFKSGGIDVKPELIFNSSIISMSFLKSHYSNIKKIYIIGEENLQKDARSYGFEVVSGDDHHDKKLKDEEEFRKMPIDNVDAVLVGFDPRFNYYQLSYASVCIQKGAKFFATNEDKYWSIDGLMIPGSAALTSGITMGCGVSPIVMGKPNPHGFDVISAESGSSLDKSKWLMVGDKLESDMLFGRKAGIDTCLVLTGATNEERLKIELSGENPPMPTYVCKNLSLE